MDPQTFWGNGTSATEAAPAGGGAGAPANSPPGAAPVPAAGVGASQTGQQPPQETEDQRAIREAREQLAATARERDQLRGTLGQVEQWAQSQAQQQQRQAAQAAFQREHDQIWQTAQNMGTEDAFRYAREQTARLTQNLQGQIDQISQQSQVEKMQVARQLATPLWAQELARYHQLPAEAVQELLGYGDPEVMQRQAPIVAQRYHQMQQLQEQLNQLSRSQQAGAMQRAGAGLAGGQNAPPAVGQYSDDPDIRAMQILAQLRAARQQQSQ